MTTPGDHGDLAREHRDKAAGVTVPAEAVERGARAAHETAKAVRWERLSEEGRDSYRTEARAALAAAAPLIVAGRDATIEAQRADVAASHALVSAARVSMDRLTAERDAAVETTRQGIAAAIEAERLAVQHHWTLTDAARAKAFGEAAGIAREWTP